MDEKDQESYKRKFPGLSPDLMNIPSPPAYFYAG